VRLTIDQHIAELVARCKLDQALRPARGKLLRQNEWLRSMDYKTLWSVDRELVKRCPQGDARSSMYFQPVIAVSREIARRHREVLNDPEFPQKLQKVVDRIKQKRGL
jgi:hypothetical protein